MPVPPQRLAAVDCWGRLREHANQTARHFFGKDTGELQNRSPLRFVVGEGPEFSPSSGFASVRGHRFSEFLWTQQCTWDIEFCSCGQNKNLRGVNFSLDNCTRYLTFVYDKLMPS